MACQVGLPRLMAQVQSLEPSWWEEQTKPAPISCFLTPPPQRCGELWGAESQFSEVDKNCFPFSENNVSRTDKTESQLELPVKYAIYMVVTRCAPPHRPLRLDAASFVIVFIRCLVLCVCMKEVCVHV